MKYGMVIDQQLCVGCAACTIACKAENNTPDNFNWCDKITRTEGKFPNVKYEYISTMCNHCEDAPCVNACPTTAMYKNTETGLTLHDPDKCIGCKACTIACPYGVINVNWDEPHAAWAQDDPLVEGGTYSPAEMVAVTGAEGSPHGNPERATTYPVVRSAGTVEKCNFCDHRLAQNLEPACVMACPSRARIVGDLDDPDSEINALIARHDGRGLREELGTKPRVYYIRNYTPQRRLV
jgi:Fe-S-cluster-containing dehydrogenase component